jgi:multiple sugar transport system permease protein
MIRFGIGKKYLYPFVISLRLIPPILFAIPLFIIYSNTGLIDSIVGLILVHTLISVPLALILFIGFIQDLPPEIEEAGMVDGASTLQIFNILVVPLLLPSIGAVAALSFLWSWNEYLFSYILTFGKATTVTVGASLFITAWGIKWGDISAAIFLSIIPTLIFVFFIQRYLVRGLTFGSVKG